MVLVDEIPLAVMLDEIEPRTIIVPAEVEETPGALPPTTLPVMLIKPLLVWDIAF